MQISVMECRGDMSKRRLLRHTPTIPVTRHSFQVHLFRFLEEFKISHTVLLLLWEFEMSHQLLVLVRKNSTENGVGRRHMIVALLSLVQLPRTITSYNFKEVTSHNPILSFPFSFLYFRTPVELFGRNTAFASTALPLNADVFVL